MAVRRAGSVILLLVIAALGYGCGGPKVDEKKPVAEIRTEAQKMTSRELRRVADAYGEAVVEKRDAIDDLRDRLEDLEPEEIANQGAATLKKDADAVATSIAALDERQKLYLDLLQTKVDEEKPVAQVEAEMAAMPVEKITAVAKAYRDTILKRRGEVAELNRELAEMKAAGKEGADAAKIARKVAALQASDAVLAERLTLYVRRLGEKGVDTTGLTLP